MVSLFNLTNLDSVMGIFPPISLMAKDVGHLFMCILKCHLYILHGQVSFQILYLFLIGSFYY